MNVLIVEDEPLAAERLTALLKNVGEKFVLQGVLGSIEEVVAFFLSGQKTDLLLLDFKLAEENGFDIFNRITVDSPIIFTTDYDWDEPQASKHNNIHYLLKTVQNADQKHAIAKWKGIETSQNIIRHQLPQSKDSMLNSKQKPKTRLLIKSGNKLQYKLTDQVAWYFADGKEVYIYTRNENKKFLIDYTLEQLESLLDQQKFFRISRSVIVNVDAIAEVKGLISNRMEVKLNQPCDRELTISRDRCAAFKVWLDQ